MTRETVAAIALCLVTAMAMVWMVEVPRNAGVPPADPAASPLPVATKEANYVGNIKSKKFHKLSCRYAKCPNCKAKFVTRQEAIAAGFDPCGNCDP